MTALQKVATRECTVMIKPDLLCKKTGTERRPELSRLMHMFVRRTACTLGGTWSPCHFTKRHLQLRQPFLPARHFS